MKDKDQLFIHYKNDEAFVRKVLDYQQRALLQQRMILTSFLNPHLQQIVHSIIGKHNGLKVQLNGGVKNAEYQRIIIAPDYFEINREDFEIVIYRIDYNKKFFKLRHQDLLGGLMSLGLKRESFGDILLDEESYIVTDRALSHYIETSLTKISKAPIQCIEVDLPLERKQEYEEKTAFIASFRLDVIVSTLFHLSRKKANAYISSGFVKVNYKEVEEISYLCHNKDIISVRRYGRVQIYDLEQRTQSNNHVIKGCFYK